MKKLILLITILYSTVTISQNITGKELLDKAIAYHDPNNNWATFNGDLHITMKTPNSANRDSNITINLPEEYFYIKAKSDTITTEYTVTKDNCKMALNGSTDISEADIKLHRLSCDRANLYKNYYTYLYGLPMKLKDPGTNIHETVERKTFKGKDYLVLKATYDESVGSDIWYFYFNSETYAMEIYQFFKTDDSEKLKPDSGEYILLTEETTINNIKIPKNRAWYYNKDDKYLGTDFLKQ